MWGEREITMIMRGGARKAATAERPLKTPPSHFYISHTSKHLLLLCSYCTAVKIKWQVCDFKEMQMSTGDKNVWGDPTKNRKRKQCFVSDQVPSPRCLARLEKCTHYPWDLYRCTLLTCTGVHSSKTVEMLTHSLGNLRKCLPDSRQLKKISCMGLR